MSNTTKRDEGTFTFVSSFSTASFTPSANSLLMLCLNTEAAETINTVTGHGAWEFVGNVSFGASYGLVWACKVGDSPSAAQLDVVMATSGRGTYAVAEIVGHDSSLTIANMFVQSATDGSNLPSGGTVLTPTLAAFADPDNITLCLGFSSGSVVTFEPEAPLVEQFETTQGHAWQVAFNSFDGEDTTPGMVTAGVFRDASALAFELVIGVPSPDITGTPSNVERGGAFTITGTDFGATQGGSTLTYGGESVASITSWSDTEVQGTIDANTSLKHSVQGYQFVMTVNLQVGTSVNVPLVAQAGNAFVDVGSPNSNPNYRITAIPDWQIGDQAEYVATTTPSGYAVVVEPDLSYSIDTGGLSAVGESFDIRSWDVNDSTWGSFATQTVGQGGVSAKTVNNSAQIFGVNETFLR